jgi:hypothetical protein
MSNAVAFCEPSPRRHAGPIGPALRVFGVFVLASVLAGAQPDRGESLLLGAGTATPRAHVALDPWLPTGSPVFGAVMRPAETQEPAACSRSYPVCVHRAQGVEAQTALAVLQALEKAYERLVLAMGLPAFLPDFGRGGTDGLDAYVRAGSELELTVGYDWPELDYADRAAAFCVLQVPTGAGLDRVATHCVGEAIALRLDASESPGTRSGFATQLWLASGRIDGADLAAIDDLQSNPQLGIASPELGASAEGMGLFLEFLDATLSRSGAGVLSSALLALSSGKTAPQALLWDNEPDIFDVLRDSLPGGPRQMAQLMADFAVTRGFLGDRDDGAHLPSLSHAGAFGRVRFDWVMDFSSLPRRVASARPLQPSGSMYVWLNLKDVPADATLAVQAEWEPPAAFGWVLVKVDEKGRELSRVHLPFRQRDTRVEQTLVGLDQAAAVIVAGINLGGIDPSHPFDPDVTPFEPHSCTVYLARI